MKVLRILSTLDPETGGPASVFSAAVASIVAAGVEVECLTLHQAGKDIAKFPDYERLVEQGVNVHAFRTRAGALMFLLRSIGRFDIVHVDGCWQSLCVAALFISKLMRRHTVVSPHESLTKEELRRTRSPARLAIKRALRVYYRVLTDCIVYSSALELNDSIPHPNAVVIRHPVFDDRQASAPSDCRDGFAVPGQMRLGYLGRLHAKKNIEKIVGAAIRTPQVRLLVAGTGVKDYEDSLRALAKSIDRVEWLGFVRKDQREQFFRSIDFLVMYSEYECFGMSAAEALVRGVPVILSRAVGIADDVREMKSGFVANGDEASLADVYAECCKLSLDTYRELQQNTEAAAHLYSFSTHAKAQIGVYASLTSRTSITSATPAPSL